MWRSLADAWEAYGRRVNETPMGPLFVLISFMFGVMVGLYGSLAFTGVTGLNPVLMTLIVGSLVGIGSALVLRLRLGFIHALTYIPWAWGMSVVTSWIERPFLTALGIGQVVIILYLVGAFVGVWIGEWITVVAIRLKLYWTSSVQKQAELYKQQQNHVP